MPRCAKRRIALRFWHMLDAEQRRWYKEWFVPHIVEDHSRTEFHLMAFEVDILLILRGHHHTDAKRVATFFFDTKRGRFSITRYSTNAVIQGFMFKMTWLRGEGE